MNKEQFQLWKAFKRDSMVAPSHIAYGDIKRILLYPQFSDSVYAYIIQHIISTGNAKLYDTLLCDVVEAFKENRLKNFGNRTHQKLLIIINELIFESGTESHVVSLLYIEAVVRFFNYIRYNDINFDVNMFDVLLFNIISHAKLRSNRSLYYKRLSRQLKFILLDYDYTDELKSKVLIQQLSDALYNDTIGSDMLENIMFDDDGDYATELLERKRIFDKIIRCTNYMKLTNQDKA